MKLFITSETDSDRKNKLSVSPRINIDYAGEYKDKPWRFFLNGNEFVSRVNR